MTASEDDLLAETVRALVKDHGTPAAEGVRWDSGLWSALVDAGLTGVGVPEELGGSGGELSHVVAVVGALAAGAAAVPVAEQLLVASPALLEAGLPLPPVDEPTTIALDGDVRAEPQDARGGTLWTLRGTARDVPWAGVAQHVAVLAPVASSPGDVVLACVAADGLRCVQTDNLAGEARGSVHLDGVGARGALVDGRRAEAVRARFALARALQLAAALEQVLQWTVEYAQEREQFGRALAHFQAVQMDLARMAGEVAAVTALVDAALQALGRGEAELPLLAAAAKARAGQAVELVVRPAHQVHGALGFTREHRLQLLTRRCWSWRDEAGTESAWALVLGRALAAPGEGELWPSLTRLR